MSYQITDHGRSSIAGASQDSRRHHLQPVEELKNRRNQKQRDARGYDLSVKGKDSQDGIREQQETHTGKQHETSTQI